MGETTTIEVKEDTWKKLMRRKGIGDSFDDVVSDLIEIAEEYENENEED